jgi:hypothetical protein
MTVDEGNGRRPRPDLSQSRFLCNGARRTSLVCFVIAFAALVIGGGFAEISTSGAPTSLETTVVRSIMVVALLVGFVAYLIGGRIRAGRA